MASGSKGASNTPGFHQPNDVLVASQTLRGSSPQGRLDDRDVGVVELPQSQPEVEAAGAHRPFEVLERRRDLAALPSTDRGLGRTEPPGEFSLRDTRSL